MYKDMQELHSAVMAKANHHDINPAKIAVSEYGVTAIGNPDWWWKPQNIDDCEDVYVDNIDLLAGLDNTLSRFVCTLADSVQFPRSTAFLHGLGVVSAAMTERFFYEFNGGQKNTVALYTVGAQPPSTGKSAIDAYLGAPIHAAYTEKSQLHMEDRARINVRINKKRAALKKAGEREAEEIAVELMKLEHELDEHPVYTWCVNDPTPEGCEKILAKQGGFFNVVSDETSAVSVILGMVYGDGARNNGVFLKAWDNGYLSVARAGREGFSGNIRGSMAVLAQDASVEAILQAGQSGEGISERFMILRERNLLGTRDHTIYNPVDKDLQEQYKRLVDAIVMTGYDVYLKLSDEAQRLVRQIKQDQEPLMRDGGKYSSPMLRGVVGKNEKQIIKIACVLHVVQEWASTGNRKTEIPTERVFEASYIFGQLLRTYVAAADSKGFTGKQTELNRIVEALTKMAGKNKLKIDTRALRDAIKNSRQFQGIDRLTEKLRTEYMPDLEKTAHLVYDDASDTIYINPHIK